MKRTAKYLVYMLTVVLIASVIGVAFAWYSSNTTVTATSSATAAKAENVNISFLFKDGDDATNKIYLSESQIIADYYNRSIYTGEEGWSAQLNDGKGGMVGCETELSKDGDSIHLKDPDERNGIAGSRDHVFTLFYYIEIQSEGKEVDFVLNLNSVKIYKNGVTLLDEKGEAVENSKVEYPLMSGEGEDAKPVGSGTIAEVTVGGTSYYFDVTEKTVYGTVGDDGTLSDAMTEEQASYDISACKLTVGSAEYTLSGHEFDKYTDSARYFGSDAEEVETEDSSIDNFVFNFYQVDEKPENGQIFNKAHEGDYKIYTKGTDADEVFAEPSKSISVGSGDDGNVAKIIIAITHFQKIDVDEDGNLTEVNAVFPYSSKEYMKSHFKFNISAELSK